MPNAECDIGYSNKCSNAMENSAANQIEERKKIVMNL